MKTQIIQLEPHDDTISIKDKMEWSQTSRILLVIPAQGKIINGRLDLILLKRHSSALGSQLAIVTKDPGLIFYADQLGIPIFPSIKTAQKKPWRQAQHLTRQIERPDSAPSPEIDLSERPIKKTDLIHLPLWGRLGVFTLGVLSVIAIAILLLPRAVITLPGPDQTQELLLPVRADASLEEIQVSGNLPARKISQLIVHSTEIASSGQTTIPETYASGEALFTKLVELPLTIPEGSVLSTGGDDPILYHTQEMITLPEGYGSQGSVAIKAVVPGISGNLSSDQITEINAEFGADVTVTNPDPTSGGSDLAVPAPTEADREQVFNRALLESAELAILASETQITPADLLLCDSPQLEEIREQAYTPQVGMPADHIRIDLSVEYSCYYVLEQDLQQLTETFLTRRYQGEKKQPILDSVSYTQIGYPAMDGQLSTPWEMKITWRETPRIDKPEAIRQVLGLSPQQAAEVLTQAYDLETAPEIKLIPGWWIRMPVLPFRIEMK